LQNFCYHKVLIAGSFFSSFFSEILKNRDRKGWWSMTDERGGAVQRVREYLDRWNRGSDILEMEESTATVAEAAAALGVIPARIAKSLSLRRGQGAMIVVTAGDVKLDNRKFRERFGFKARMLDADEALALTGFSPGGVCPFALPEGVPVCLDLSLKRFETVFPACGSGNSAIELSLAELEEYTRSSLTGNASWVDVCADS
jgi:prolyl-tRNA editing enzyme YbaK/EbsC (Cys-tRNA(Pro) deacylase)